MNAKTGLTLVALVIELMWLPISFYSQWLVLGKIQGTDLMYFLYWLALPLAIISSTIGSIIRGMKND